MESHLGATYSTIAKLGITGDPEIIADTEYGSDSVASAVFYYGDGTYCVGGLAKEEGLETQSGCISFSNDGLVVAPIPNVSSILWTAERLIRLNSLLLSCDISSITQT